MKRKLKSEFLEAETFNLKRILYLEQDGCGVTGPTRYWHLLQADIHPCPAGEVGQMELPYLGPAHAEDVVLVRAM